MFYNQGGLAVPIFWAISGFIFFWKYSQSIYSRKTNFASFFMLRFSRLYPLHFATLLLVAFLQAFYYRSHGVSFVYEHNDLFHFALQLLFASNWLDSEPWTFNGPIWSVSVEIVIYMAFFYLMLMTRPSAIQCLLAIVLAKILMHFNLQSSISHCIYFFFAGGLLQRIDQSIRSETRKFAFMISVLFAITVLALLGLHVVSKGQTSELLLAASVVNTFVLVDNFVPAFNRVAWMGNLTYSSYLIHFPIQISLVLVLDAFHISRSLFLSPLVFLAFLAATFTLGWLVYHVYEMPMQNLIRSQWFLIDRRRAPATAAKP